MTHRLYYAEHEEKNMMTALSYKYHMIGERILVYAGRKPIGFKLCEDSVIRKLSERETEWLYDSIADAANAYAYKHQNEIYENNLSFLKAFEAELVKEAKANG